MKIHLLPKGKQYKANLHSHSTISDAHLPVEQVAKNYKEHGYSILAMTDHEILRDHSRLSSDDFIMLTSYELTVREEDKTTNRNKVCHLNLYARDPHNEAQVQFDRKVSERYANYGVGVTFDLDTLKGATPSDKRTHTVEYVNKVIKEAGENGFLVCYNHAGWSNEEMPDYTGLKGLACMEIVNYSSLNCGIWEYNVREYDQMLRDGQRIGCVATDDNHNEAPLDAPENDSFGGWTMFPLKSLSYDDVIAALEKGDYYASTGPEIEEFYYDTEDKLLHIKCSPAARIILNSCGRRFKTAYAPKGKTLTEATLPLIDDTDYIRLTIDDGKGHYAFSRGYFLDEFVK